MNQHAVFLGGATLGLLITEPGAPPPRPTQDVDIVVEVVTTREYQDKLRSQLLNLGFREILGEDPICRWSIEEIRVDIMPTRQEILGFNNRWYAAAFAYAQPYQFPEGPSIRLVSPACFLATKLDAFASRGKGDYLRQDMEDIIAVVDGRSSIERDAEEAPVEIRDFIAHEFRKLLSTQAFLDSLPGHLPGDDASQARLPGLINRLTGIARLRR